jgi:glucose/mannose-6-phosphate isomerase
MLQAIKDFPKQFTFQPVIKNRKNYKRAKKFIVLGMGGSHLAADIIKATYPSLQIIIRSNYGLPNISDRELKEYLIIASSYSGNTEEVVDGLKKAYKKKLNIICIAIGGKILRFAKKNQTPYIQIPDTDIQPRSALGLSLRAMLKSMGLNKTLASTDIVASKLRSGVYEKRGKKIARLLKNKIPVIYTSEANFDLAYNWKIKLNETGKIPAFYNVLPELNHNEMNGFDVVTKTRPLTKHFCFIFLHDSSDHPKVIKRIKVLAKLYKKRKLKLISLKIDNPNKWLKIFNNLTLADWISYYTALNYGRDPEQVPLVEEFKSLIK